MNAGFDNEASGPIFSQTCSQTGAALGGSRGESACSHPEHMSEAARIEIVRIAPACGLSPTSAMGRKQTFSRPRLEGPLADGN